MSDTAQTPVIYLAIDGKTAPVDLSRRVISLEVDEHAKKATKITLTLTDPDGAVRNGDLIREGQTIGVRWGYVGTLSAARGAIVHKINPSYADDTVKIEAFGRELALSKGAIRRTFRGRTFRQALEELCNEGGVPVQWEAAQPSGTTGGTSPLGGVRLDAQVIDNEHAWAWILRQSSALGLEVEMDSAANNGAGLLIVREPRLGDAAHTVLHYNWRNAEILSFEVETNTKKKESENEGVVALFFDPATGETLRHAAGSPNTTRRTLAARRVEAEARRNATARAAEDAGRTAFVSAHPELLNQTPAQQRTAYERSRTEAARTGHQPTEDEPSFLVDLSGDHAGVLGSTAPSGAPAAATTATAPTVIAADRTAAREHVRQLAEGAFKARDRGKVKAKVTIIGSPQMRRGKVVQVVGVSPRDAGLWMVDACIHKVGAGDGFEVELELKREGINGANGARPGAAAQQNQHRGAETPGMREPEPTVAVDLAH